MTPYNDTILAKSLVGLYQEIVDYYPPDIYDIIEAIQRGTVSAVPMIKHNLHFELTGLGRF